jgi:glycosyltransferase involved in cell wall biosynthesis
MKINSSRKNHKADVAIWGHVPPPYGGMTVHIQRLIPKLIDAGISVQTYNFNDPDIDDNRVLNYKNRKFLWIIRLFFGKVEKVHYVISVQPIVRFISVLFGRIRNKKVILRIGGASLQKSILNGNYFMKIITRFALRNATLIIGVNKDICNIAKTLGVEQEKIHNIPGFIPPVINGSIIPDEVDNFFKGKSPKFLITGFLSSSKENDTYGIRDSLYIMNRLKLHYPNVGLVIFSQNVSDELKLIFDKLIKEYNLSSSVLIHYSRSELWPVFKVIDIFLRPTYSDGDANSIREALYFGVPVIASNCVKRPTSVITYTKGNTDELYKTITSVLRNINSIKSQISKITVEDNSQPIVNIILNLLKVN